MSEVIEDGFNEETEEILEMTEEESNQAMLETLEKKELMAIVDKYSISVIAKNKNKPNNKEIIKSILAYKKEQDVINGTAQMSEEDIEAELAREEKKKAAKEDGVATPNKKLPRQQRARLQRADLMRKELVIIHDNRTSQTKPNVEFVTWGNGLIGMTTSVVGFNQPKGQYVHRGALQNLRNAPAIMHVQDDRKEMPKQVEVPAFTIVPLTGLSEEEIEAKGRNQRMRDAGTV